MPSDRQNEIQIQNPNTITHDINDKTQDECWKLEHNAAWQRREGEASINAKERSWDDWEQVQHMYNNQNYRKEEEKMQHTDHH